MANFAAVVLLNPLFVKKAKSSTNSVKDYLFKDKSKKLELVRKGA